MRRKKIACACLALFCATLPFAIAEVGDNPWMEIGVGEGITVEQVVSTPVENEGDTQRVATIKFGVSTVNGPATMTVQVTVPPNSQTIASANFGVTVTDVLEVKLVAVK